MVSASARQFSALETHFGPPSEAVDVSQFIKDHSGAPPPPELCNAEEDFQVADICDSVSKIWDNPLLSAYLVKTHDLAVDEMYRLTKPDAKRKKQLEKTFSASAGEDAESVKELKSCLEGVGISSYGYPPEAAYFTRQVKTSDQNALTEIKTTIPGAACNQTEDEALVIVSMYSKGARELYRSSQHAFLSSQTLGDLFESFPCVSKDIPLATREPGRPTKYAFPSHPIPSTGVAILFEQTLYSDGLNEPDHADKLIKSLQDADKLPPGITKSPTSIYEAQLRALPLRTQEPYWLVHQENCEHYFIVDQIRMKHDSDVCAGYPLTLQLTPISLDLCRGCSRVPAVWSIVGDERMGESPCVLCGPCWRSMGDPPNDASINVIPLPRYQIGWE